MGKRINTRKGVRITWILAAFVIALLVTGQVEAKSKVPEVVKIKVGGVLTFSGPGAAWHGPGAKAQITYFKFLERQGGIKYTEPDGSKHRFLIDHKYEDCTYSPKKAVTTYGRLRDWGAHLLIVHGSSPSSATSTMAIRDRMPMLHEYSVHASPMSYLENVDKEYLLANGPTNVTIGLQNLIAYKKGVWDKKHPGERLKAGIIAFDNPPRRLYKHKSVKGVYSKAGIDLVGVEIVPIASTDLSIQLNRIYRAGAKVMLLDHATSGVKVALEDAIRLGIKDKVDFIGWYNLLRELLTLPELFDGFYNPWLSPAYYVEGRSKAIEECCKTYLDDDPEYWTYRVDQAITIQHVLMAGIEAIKRCLEQYGYEGFTREKLRTALFNLTELDTGIYPKFSIDPEFPLTQPYTWLYRLDAKNKIYRQIGPVVAPGPSLFCPRWNPGVSKDAYSHYYE